MPIPYSCAQDTATGLRVRENASLLPSTHNTFKKYAEAVKAMHDLPATDPRSWRKQAEIHPNHCAHGTSGFLPWHRHYINQFEKICGELIDDSDFALPYWDWTAKGGKIPDAFFDLKHLNVAHWNDDGDGNFPSNWGSVDSRGTRGLTKGDRMQDDPTRGGNFTVNRINEIKGTADFSTFWRQLESSPHNTGHVLVGLVQTGKVGHMLDGLSPLDPLFWLHHCNIDRIWAEWQLAGNSTHPFAANYNDHFVDEKGESVDVVADDSIDYESLGFTYDTIHSFGTPHDLVELAGVEAGVVFAATAPTVAALPALASIDVSESLAINTPFSIPIEVRGMNALRSERQSIKSFALPPAGAVEAVDGGAREAIKGFGESIKVRKRIYARIEGARTTSKLPPSVGVYLNCQYLTAQTPYTDEHYAGSFSFFGHRHHDEEHEHGHGMTTLVDITDTVERLGLTETGKLKVQLVPTVPGGSEGVVTVKKISIVSS